MSGAVAPLAPAADGRVIGTYQTGRPGPSVVAIAAVHGNEPAGVAAARGVLDALGAVAPPLAGRFVAVVGNRAALRANRRYLRRDLNRLWTPEQVTQLDASDPAGDDVEGAEQRALLAVLMRLEADADDVVYLDLHSTSAPGPPFHCISDTLHARRIALATPIPLILGVEEAIRGSLLEFMEARGRPLILVEGGCHDDPATIRYHEATIWQALVTTGALAPEDVPDYAGRRMRLAAAGDAGPQVVEVIYRHPVDGRFRMRPGFRSFDRVRRGDVLADDGGGPVRAPAGGILLMPLYQEQGEDGFFLARPVHRFWLAVSAAMRAARVDRLLPHLPGVRPEPGRPGRFVADRRIARWFTLQLFHLCGYRRVATRDHDLVFTRRVER